MTAPSLNLVEAAGLGSIAALPMYDSPELRAANDSLWSAIADRLAWEGIEAPVGLTRGADLEGVWRDPSLLLAQTCGYPLTTSLRGMVQVVATPRYAAPGCAAAFHRSAIIVSARSPAKSLEDLRGARCAFNDARSNTGVNLLRAEAAPLARDGRFFGEVRQTGSHAASLVAVAVGEADVAAIDCVTLALLARDNPDLVEAVRPIKWTVVCPGLPLVTAAAMPKAGVWALRRVLQDVADDPALEPARRALLIQGFSILPEALYEQIPHLERSAAERGYPDLA